jgi:transcriptional regulator of acetoin/glycerol metabolism
MGGAGDDHRRDFEDGSAPDTVMLRSADYFRRRAAGCRTERQVADVLADAQTALRSYQRSPRPANPEHGSWAWREQIARDIDTGRRTRAQAMQHYGISRTTLWRIMKTYGRTDGAA